MNETGREQDMLYMEELERVTEERDRLRDALKLAERRSKQQEENINEYYKRLAKEFYERFGYLPPIGDDPLRTVDREILHREWEEFLAEPAKARRAALKEVDGE